jgi:hypothetical protein
MAYTLKDGDDDDDDDDDKWIDALLIRLMIYFSFALNLVLYARNKRREPYSFFNLILTLSKIPIS